MLLSNRTCFYVFSFQKNPTEQLQVAYENLERAINGMNTFRLMTLLPDGKSIFDNCCTKVKFTKSYTATKSINNLIYTIFVAQPCNFLILRNLSIMKCT